MKERIQALQNQLENHLDSNPQIYFEEIKRLRKQLKDIKSHSTSPTAVRSVVSAPLESGFGTGKPNQSVRVTKAKPKVLSISIDESGSPMPMTDTDMDALAVTMES